MLFNSPTRESLTWGWANISEDVAPVHGHYPHKRKKNNNDKVFESDNKTGDINIFKYLGPEWDNIYILKDETA